ncbi:MAG: hydantoinase/oxoprolinase family protein [Pseudomonadota bacterium]
MVESLRIGVDFGGTNTDAVLMSGSTVAAAHKQPTTQDIQGGVVSAIRSVLDQARIEAGQVRCVMIGTTQFTNAFVERRHLVPVGVLRIAEPAARGIPPLSDWPDDLKAVIGPNVRSVRGGYQFDGRENASLDGAAVIEAAKGFKRAGLNSVAISGLFSPVNDAMELEAERLVRRIMPDCAVTLSSRIGRIGLLERENAAIMNASLAELSVRVVASFASALRTLGMDARYFISQNDGTLMSAADVRAYPVLTFASGPTNSMRGAAYLSGLNDAVVADIGGTTTDIGILSGGFPRQSALAVDIGGVRTNFRMPDIIALPLGGGSVVSLDPLSVGPQSVGHNLLESARIFGGSSLTASDIAVASGQADFGDWARVSGLDPGRVWKALDLIHTRLADGVDRMKTDATPVPLILVGGGSVLIGRDVPGVSSLIVPERAGVANAIGASISQVGGTVDRVYAYDELGRDACLDDAKARSRALATKAGAAPSTIDVIDLEEVPLPYLPGGSVRVRVKSAGALDLEGLT